MRNLCRLLVAAMLIAPVVAFAVDDKVNINTADKYKLEKELKGVNWKVAENIVDFRDRHGSFAEVEQLEQVEGIGYDTLNINRENIVVD